MQSNRDRADIEEAHMIPSFRKPRRRRLAFTVVELLVVVAIIGVLVSILLPAVGAVRDSARRTQNGNNLRNIGFTHFPCRFWVKKQNKTKQIFDDLRMIGGG